MNTYHIYSRAGADFGCWPGRRPGEALAALHRDAGYRIRYSYLNDTLVADDAETERLCGQVADWHIEEHRP